MRRPGSLWAPPAGGRAALLRPRAPRSMLGLRPRIHRFAVGLRPAWRAPPPTLGAGRAPRGAWTTEARSDRAPGPTPGGERPSRGRRWARCCPGAGDPPPRVAVGGRAPLPSPTRAATAAARVPAWARRGGEARARDHAASTPPVAPAHRAPSPRAARGARPPSRSPRGVCNACRAPPRARAGHRNRCNGVSGIPERVLQRVQPLPGRPQGRLQRGPGGRRAG